MKRAISFSIIVFVAGVIVAAFVSYSAVKESKRNKDIDVLISSLEEEKARISLENNSLKDKIAYLETSDFQEKIAREKLNMQRTDEKVAVVKTSPQVETQNVESGQEQIVQEDNRKNYTKWYEHFFAY